MKINTSFYLKPWRDNLHDWADRTNTLQQQILKAYSHQPSFERYYLTFQEDLDEDRLLQILKSDDEALLPFTFLAKNSGIFFDRYNTEKIIDVLVSRKKPRTIEFYAAALVSNLTRDKRLNRSELKLLEAWTDIAKSISSETKSILRSNEIIQAATNWCIENNANPISLTSNFGFRLSPQSKFIVSLSKSVYSKYLEQADFNSSSPLISNIANRGVFNWRTEKDELFGHEILRIVINGFEHSKVHSDWIQLILNQAGDPRISTSSKTYLRWWSKIDSSLIAKFIKALSHEDIMLFLESLSDFADKANPEMKRMFKSRKRMLTGLSTQNIFSESRLFLPDSIYKFMEREKPYLNLDYVGKLSGVNDKALIYLKAGETHIIEGSHNCKLRMYDGLPSGVDLMDPQTHNWNYSSLTSELEQLYYEEKLAVPFSRSHGINGSWKKDAIRFLKRRFSFDHEKCLTDRELNDFRYE